MKAIVTILGLLALTLYCAGIEPVVTKLFSNRADGNNFDDSFALEIAASDRWILTSEVGNSEKGNNAGAAYLYDAATGKLKRKLLAPDGAAGDAFSSSLAVSGQKLLIGAPNKNSSAGLVYVFDAPTGVLLGKLQPTDATAGDQFGSAVALAGDVAVVGAIGHDGNQGALYVFDLKGLSGVRSEVRRITATVRIASTQLGTRIDTNGRIIVAGASAENSGTGAVYLFDVESGDQLRKITTGASAGDSLGLRVVLSGELVYASAPDASSGAGKVNVYDTVNGTLVDTLTSSDSAPNDQFGFGLAVNGDLVVVGEPEENSSGEGELVIFSRNNGQGDLLGSLAPLDITDDDKLGSTVAIAGNSILASADPGGNGIMYRFTPIVPTLPEGFQTRARIKDAAPGTGAKTFGSLSSVVLGDNDGENVLINGTLTGSTVSGVWHMLPESLAKAALTTDNLSPLPVGSLFIGKFGVPMHNNTNFIGLPVILRSPGATAANDQALFKFDGTLIGVVQREGNILNLAPFGSTVTLSTMHQIVQSRDTTNNQFSMACRFKTGANGVTLGNDSGILCVDENGVIDSADQEGFSSPNGTINFGQISPRVAHANTCYLFHAALLPTAPGQPKQGLFGGFFNINPTVIRAQMTLQGDSIPGAGLIDTYLGETIAGDETMLFRSTVAGPGVSSIDNEVLVSNRFGPLQSAFREGFDAGAGVLPAGVLVSKFLRFWAVNGDQVAALVQLRGTGVTTANDIALLLATEISGNNLLLAREGDLAPGCDGSRIGVIQGVEINAETGFYVMLGSLTGALANKNQALFSGDLNRAAIGQKALRRPSLALRKGTAYQGPFGAVTTLKSISLGTKSASATGASEGGLPTCIANGDRVGLRLTFSDGSVHAVELEL